MSKGTKAKKTLDKIKREVYNINKEGQDVVTPVYR